MRRIDIKHTFVNVISNKVKHTAMKYLVTLTFLIFAITANAQTSTTDTLTVLNFTADWCAPCEAMQTDLNDLQSDIIDVVDIDVNTDYKTPTKYNVRALPCFVVTDSDGNALATYKEVPTKKQLSDIIKN